MNAEAGCADFNVLSGMPTSPDIKALTALSLYKVCLTCSKAFDYIGFLLLSLHSNGASKVKKVAGTSICLLQAPLAECASCFFD